MAWSMLTSLARIRSRMVLPETNSITMYGTRTVSSWSPGTAWSPVS